MALQNIFGTSLGQLPAQAGGNIALIADGAPPSGWALRSTSSSSTSQATLVTIASLAASADPIIVGGWFYIPTGVTNFGAVSVTAQGGNFDSVRLDTNIGGTFTFGVNWNDSGVLSQSFGSIPEIRDEWFHMAIWWAPDNTTGSFKLRINGADVGLDIASGDTQATGVGGILTRDLRLRGVGVLAHSIYVADSTGAAPYNDIIAGTPKVDSQTVNGSGTSDWVGSDANSVDNHLLVDEAPTAAADTTDYIESATATNRQIFDTAAMGLTGTVHAVKVTAWGRDTDAAGQAVDLGVISNATESTSQVVLAGTDGEVSAFFAEDPDGAGTPWDEAARNALDVVLEVV